MRFYYILFDDTVDYFKGVILTFDDFVDKSLGIQLKNYKIFYVSPGYDNNTIERIAYYVSSKRVFDSKNKKQRRELIIRIMTKNDS